MKDLYLFSFSGIASIQLKIFKLEFDTFKKPRYGPDSPLTYASLNEE